MLPNFLAVLIATHLFAVVGHAGIAITGWLDPYDGHTVQEIKLGSLPTIRTSVFPTQDVFGAGYAFWQGVVPLGQPITIKVFGVLFDLSRHNVGSAAFTGFPQLTGLKLDLHQGARNDWRGLHP